MNQRKRFFDSLETIISATKKAKFLSAQCQAEDVEVRAQPKKTGRVDRALAISAVEEVIAWQARTGVVLLPQQFWAAVSVLSDIDEA